MTFILSRLFFISKNSCVMHKIDSTKQDISLFYEEGCQFFRKKAINLGTFG